MNQRFYTVADLADLLAVKPVTIYRMVRRGQLPAVKIGRSIRFSPDDVADFLKSVRLKPQQDAKHA